MAALLTDEIHVTNLPDDLVVEATSRGYAIAKGNVPALRTFVSLLCCFVERDTDTFRFEPSGPVSDVRVRKAMSKAINREEVNFLFGGKGTPMHLNTFHPTRPAWNREWETRFDEEYGYDPAAAKALLTEAGYGPSNPAKVTMLARNLPFFAGSLDVADAVAGFWSDVGMDVNTQQIDQAVYRSEYKDWKYTNHATINGTSSAHLFGLKIWNASLISQAGFNMSHPDVNIPLRIASGVLDAKKRNAMLVDIGNTIYDLHMDIPLFWLPPEAVYNPNIIASYTYSGALNGTYSDPDGIKAVKN